MGVAPDPQSLGAGLTGMWCHCHAPMLSLLFVVSFRLYLFTSGYSYYPA